MKSHSPTPWKVTSVGIPFIRDANDTTIGITEINCLQDEKTERANSEYIVKCVNMHERLVDALKTIQEYNGHLLIPVIKISLDNILKELE